MGGFTWKPAITALQLEARLFVGVEEGARAAAEHLLGVSSELAPIEEGTLSRSGTTSYESTPRRGTRAAVSFDTPYVVRQHEDLSLRHDDGRQAKFLEQPMSTERDVMARLVQQAVRRRLERP